MAPPKLRWLGFGVAGSRPYGLQLQATQQQMEVDEARVGCPADHSFVRALRAARLGQKTTQAVQRTDVALREHVQSSEAAQQYVVGTPAPDAALSDERLDDRRVVQLFERLEFELPGRRGSGELEDRLGFALAEAERPEGGWRQAEDG